MEFGCLGINYKNASLDVRDHTAFTENKKIDFFEKLDDIGIHQALILSTCNRSEIFFFYQDEREKNLVKRLYQETFFQVNLDHIMFCLDQDEALEHLFLVAAGLDSAVLGEDQILGQLKDAMMLSKALGFCKKQMHRVVENAMACAKEAKSVYGISQIPLSVSYIGIKEVARRVGFEGKHILILGSGDTARLALEYVEEYPVASVTICSRNLNHARRLLAGYQNTSSILYEERYDYLNQVDIVISATSAPHFAIEAKYCDIHRSLVFLDLAAPRDVDLELALQEGVTLINLDSLERISRQNQKERGKRSSQCLAGIQQGVAMTKEWLFESRVDDTISSLHARCQEITDESFAYLSRKLTLSQREEKILHKILFASLKKLLREPILELKQLESTKSQDEYTRMLKELFHLEEKGEDDL